MTTGDVTDGVDHSCDGKGECQGDHAKISHGECQCWLGTIEKKNCCGNGTCTNPCEEGSSEQFSDKFLSEGRCPVHTIVVCLSWQTFSFRVGNVQCKIRVNLKRYVQTGVTRPYVHCSPCGMHECFSTSSPKLTDDGCRSKGTYFIR